MNKSLALAALFAITSSVWAAPQSVTLSVPDMNCGTCPITVKKALMQVPGVSKVELSLERRDAKVSFDDAKATVEALMRATREAGYPSTLMNTVK